VIRVAAVGDLHYDRHCRGRWAHEFELLNESADLFLMAGDLTQIGTAEEMEALASDLRHCSIPKVAVLGNHDLETDLQDTVTDILEKAGVVVLEGEALELDIAGEALGIAGTMGFGGGFWGASAAEFGEPEMKNFTIRTRRMTASLETALRSLQTKYRIVLMHYSPIRETLVGEPPEIFPFLGSFHFANAVDAIGANYIFHAHAHRGKEMGSTPGGIPVRNVALPVIREPYRIYSLGDEGTLV